MEPNQTIKNEEFENNTNASEIDKKTNYLLWATCPFLWAVYNKMRGGSFKSWQLYANPALWVFVIFILSIQTKAINSWPYLRDFIFFAFNVASIIALVRFLNKEFKRYALNELHILLYIVAAIFTLTISNLFSYFMYNILLPLIAFVKYLKDKQISNSFYSASIKWISIAHTIWVSFVAIILFVAFFILGLDS